MQFANRWIFSQTIATVTLFVLVAIVGLPQQLWLDIPQLWFVTMAVNHTRLAIARNL